MNMSTLTSDTTKSSLSGTSGTGQGAGGRGRGGRRRNRVGRGQSRGLPRSNCGTNFKGGTAKINGNVFECFEEQMDRRQYARIVAALEGHVKKILKYSEDLASLFAEDMMPPIIAMPDDQGADPSKTAEMIWAEEVK